jgi:hypothetical protein
MQTRQSTDGAGQRGGEMDCDPPKVCGWRCSSAIPLADACMPRASSRMGTFVGMETLADRHHRSELPREEEEASTSRSQGRANLLNVKASSAQPERWRMWKLLIPSPFRLPKTVIVMKLARTSLTNN